MSSSPTEPPLVIGIGSRLGRDDAIGIVLVEKLVESGAVREEDALLLENADAATVAATLLDLHRPVLLVDCADMGEPPGTHRIFDESSATLKLRDDAASTHGLGLADALALARALGFEQPATLFAIQPFDLSPSPRLTPEMRECLPEIMDSLRRTAAGL